MRQEAAAGPRRCSRIARRPTIVVSLPQTHHKTGPSEQGFAPPPSDFGRNKIKTLSFKKPLINTCPLPPSNIFPTALHHSTAQARVPKMQQTMPGMSGLSDAAASRAATGASDAPATPAAAAAATASIVTGISNDDDYVSSNRSVGVKKLSRHVIPVEYWIPSTSVWTESAQLSLSRAKTKLYIDIEDNNSSGLNNIGRRGSSRCY